MLEELEVMNRKKQELIDRNNALKQNQIKAESDKDEVKTALNRTAQLLSSGKAAKNNQTDTDEEVKIPAMPGKLDAALEAAVNQCPAI